MGGVPAWEIGGDVIGEGVFDGRWEMEDRGDVIEGYTCRVGGLC